MSYITESLGKNEQIVYQAKFHWIFWLMGWLALISVIILSGFLVYTLMNNASLGKETLIVILLFISLYLAWHRLVYLWSTRIAVTNHRLIVKKG